jgi:hypothetical protein
MPLQKLDNSASEWKPFGELGRAERIERPEREDIPKQVENTSMGPGPRPFI